MKGLLASRAVQLLPYFLKVLGIGAVTTVGVTIAASVVALLLGFAIALMRLSRSRILRILGAAYLEIFRNVPILTQLFILYFGLARLGLPLPAIATVIVGFGLNGAATCSEIFRGSIRAVDRGQREAAIAIGMTEPKALYWIVLPQAARIALPAIGSFAIGLLKETSLASAAAVPELAFRAKMLVSETYQTIEIYALVAILYFLLSYVFSRVIKGAELRFGRQKARAA